LTGNHVKRRPSLAERSYLVCATPRSGSTLLCETLAATGVAGRPEEYFEALLDTGLPRQPAEYFDPGADEVTGGRLPTPRRGRPLTSAQVVARLRDALERGTTPNGVFGAKMMWGYLGDFLRGMRGAGLAEADDARLLGAAFPRLRYVHVARDDKVGQAVSLWRAVQTQAWRHDGDEAGAAEAVYRFAAVDHLVALLTEHERAWGAWFAAHGIEPATVRYEELAADPGRVARRVLEDLGIEPPPAGVAAPAMRRQADARSQAWARRYAEERQALLLD
jgi:LPS sulfotransferase NodH